ncbi:MAG: glycosyltransferase WbuB [Acidobacteria bacterium]|jgi:glycosyltransferase involved in cell wall biosynthesis|nr:glycosyltransferase WbuB [Acidobacteriota bacterium]
MRILIITQIYLPEMGALANRLYPIVRELVTAGHEITVATGMPNYPAGKVFPEYRGKFFVSETNDGYKILRTAYLTAPRNKSKLSQMASYLSFMPSVLLSGFRAGKVDAVFVSSPPPFPILPAIRLAKLNGAKLIVDVRDLWSDELVAYGEMREDSLPVRIVRAIEQRGYRQADIITCTTASLIDAIVERGAKREKTFLLPNGADLELFHPLPPDNEIADSYGFGNRFVVMYSGLFGIKHGLEVLLEAAEILRDRKDIVFFLLGGGARGDALRDYIKEKSLDNVIIGSERGVKDVPHILARADVCFAAVRSEAYPKKLISVKLFEYLACEKPIVGAFEGESADVIEKSGGGIVVPPGDARATADAILKLYGEPQRRAAMGTAGRLYVEKYYSRSEWAARFEKLLTSLGAAAIPVSEPVFPAEPSIAPPGFE